MGRGRDPRGRCEGCGAEIGPSPADRPGPRICDLCASADRRRPAPEESPAVTAGGPPPLGPTALFVRRAGLRGLTWAYRLGTAGGSVALFALGGFVPVIDRWLRDEIRDWGGAVETLGGVRVVAPMNDPDADLGPVLARADAPALFSAVGQVARRLGVKPPEEVRLAFLPCCGVVAWRRSRALMLGMPLLHVLSMAELRAVVAHEMAHLARGDATVSADSSRFVEALGRALDAPGSRARGPLGTWAALCRRGGDALLSPIARAQEARADRSAAALAGGDAAASALVKTALVQPLFREVLDHYDPADPDLPNLYAFFRSFWDRLPEPLRTSLRHSFLSGASATDLDDGHPALLDRLAIVQTYPARSTAAADLAPASSTLSDLESLEQMLHNRLFHTRAVEPTVFHRAGT